ncbi:MAG: helix-turn-helix transcriptional regulator [Clostridia bacterium]|nr:helix-turn-helix transcriptional regulator [Clostridia bacterium]
MKEFASYNFNISKVDWCTLVKFRKEKEVRENRSSHGLVYFISGRANYYFDTGEILQVKANDAFLLPKFSNYIIDKLEEGECIALNFDIDDTDKTFSPFQPYTGDALALDFKKALKAWTYKNDGYLNVCYRSLYSIICAFQERKHNEYVPSNQKKTAISGRDEILKNLSSPELSVDTIAKELDITPEYFRMLFKKAFGISPRKFIIKSRMEKAKELILSKEFKIGEIAKLCGYSSTSYFTREFKRETTYLPSEYKK